MKRIYRICAMGLSVFLISGCTGQPSQMNYLSKEDVKQTALKEAGLSAKEAEFTEPSLKSRNGIDYYQVEFTAEGNTYEYDIDAMTGVILDSDAPPKDSDIPADTENTGLMGSNVTGNNTDPAGNTSNADAQMLTEEEAKAKALAHAGLTSDQVTFLKSELDFEDGVSVYEVEFFSADQKEYDYEMDAYTGEVISYDYDAEHVMPSASGTMMTAEEAKELALAQVPGAAAGNLFEFEADYEDGHTEYEGKIIYNGMEYEFEIDAYSGTFRSWEAEPADD